MTRSLFDLLWLPAILFVVTLGFITLNRYIAYKERVALAQLGFSLEDMSRHADAKRHGNRGVLWGGVITTTSGLALLLGLATIGTGAWLLGGLIPLFVGLGMVLIYFLTLGPAADTQGKKLDANVLMDDTGSASERESQEHPLGNLSQVPANDDAPASRPGEEE